MNHISLTNYLKTTCSYVKLYHTLVEVFDVLEYRCWNTM